jgi:hypothetical protein
MSVAPSANGKSTAGCRADPHARERAFVIARQEPPPGVSPEAAAVAIAEVLEIDRRHLPGMSARPNRSALNLAIFPHAIWHLLANQRPE